MSDDVPKGRTSERAARAAIVALGLALPTLTLIPFGSIWLWQNGYLIYWAIGVLLAVMGSYVLQWWVFPAKAPERSSGRVSDESEGDEGAHKGWSPLEELAWKDVQAFARSLDPERISTREDLLNVARETIEIVAGRLHAGRADPLWQFTMPEALAIIERVSRKLRLFMVERVPFGDKLTVAQALSLYRWRGAVDFFERAYDLWRLVRLANPVTALTHEARERMSKALMQWSRDEIARRLTETYVREIGRAAIDLYGGRLKVSAQALGDYVSPETAADTSAIGKVEAEPLRIIVAGQTGAGKSSVINALMGRSVAAVDNLPATLAFTPYPLARDGFPSALLIDSPGLRADRAVWDALSEKAVTSDLVLWVVAAHRPDREADRQALEAFRSYFATRLERREPPVLLVLTHIDKVRPFDEWSPPYDLKGGSTPKAANIQAAITAAAEDLGFAADKVVAVSVPPGAEPYNVDVLWKRIEGMLPEALRAHHLRRLRGLKSGRRWSSLWSEAGKAGRVIAGSFRRKKSDGELRS